MAELAEFADSAAHIANTVDAANIAELGVAAGTWTAVEAARTHHNNFNESERRLLEGSKTLSDEGSKRGQNSILLAMGKCFGDFSKEYPKATKLIVASGDVLAAALLYADLSSDIVLMVDLFKAGAWIYGTISAFIIVNAYIAMDKGVHAFVTRRATNAQQMAHLLVGFPAVPLLFDLLMAIKPLGVLPKLPKELEELLAQYKSTRSLLEVTLESLPQTILQLYLFVVFVVLKTPGDETAFEVPLSALLTSLTFSMISLLKAAVMAWFNSRALELNIFEYLNLLLSMGKGAPIEQLRSGEITECKLDGLPIDRHVVKVVATVLRKENTTLVELDLKGSITEPRADETTALAKSIARHPALKMACLDGGTFDDLHALRHIETIDLNGRTDMVAPASLALICAIVRVNKGLLTLNMKGIEMDAQQRTLLKTAVAARSVELLMDDSADEARVAGVLRKVGMNLESLASATELNWNDKNLDQEDAKNIETLILPQFAIAVTTLECVLP